MIFSSDTTPSVSTMTKTTELTPADINALVDFFTPRAVKAAMRYYSKLHTMQEKDAMFAAALEGLYQAAFLFTPARSAEFESLVEKCVAGSLERCYRELCCRSQSSYGAGDPDDIPAAWDDFADDWAA